MMKKTYTTNSQDIEALWEYYKENPDIFESKKVRKPWETLGYGIAAIALTIFTIQPSIIGLSGLVFQIIFGVFGFVFAALAIMPDTKYFSKQSGVMITPIKRKKFDLSAHTIEDIIKAFENNDFKYLSETYSTDSGSLSIQIDHDEASQTAYLLLVNCYYGKTNYSSGVKILTGDDYIQNISYLKKI